MLRGGPQFSAEDNSQQQQKQKKKLSFRDPEVEGPLRKYLYAGCKSKTLIKPTKTTNLRKTSASLEDLTLEDQALQIAQSVGNAFSDLSIKDNNEIDYSDITSANFEAQKETEIRDSSPTDFASYQRNLQFRNEYISKEDQEFLDDLVSPQLDDTMRCPSIESSCPNPPKNCIPIAEPSFQEVEGRFSSSMQHQIQMLKYQLEQQNQQTQMALHQVQMLQDQMDAESAARRKAQEQNNQLMQQNKELLNHMEKLFQQIEELEKQIQILEQEKKGKQVITPENQSTTFRKSTTWSAIRRPNSELLNEKPTKWTATQKQSSEHINEKPSTWLSTRRSSNEKINEKTTLQNRGQCIANKKTTPVFTKPLGATPKTMPTQNISSSLSTRKTPSIPARPLTFQSKNKDSGIKEKETLRIGDMSPPIQSGTTSPFNSNWTLKSPDNSLQSNTDKSLGNTTRSRTGSFSSYVQKPQESGTAKSSLFGSTSNNLSTSLTGRKYSSSTSDLYNTSSTIQGKSSLTIEEPSTSVKSTISNLSLSTSKLPRYQPYTGWRRASLTGENEQVSALSKESYKSPPKTSLFTR